MAGRGGSVSNAVSEVSERLWNNDFIKIFIIATLCNISQQMIGSTLPYYVIVLGGSPSQAGVMTGLLTLAALMSRPFVGRIVDTRGRRIVTIFGIFIFLSGTLVYIFSMNVMAVMVFRVIQGVGIACISTANGTIAADVLPEKRLSEGIAYFGLTNTLATSVGPALALSLMTGGVYSPMFSVSGLAMLGGLAIMITLRYEKQAKLEREEYLRTHPEEANPATTEAQGEKKKEKLIWRIFEKTVFRPSLVVIVLAMSMSCVLSFMPSFAISKGIDSPGMFYTATAIVILIVRVATSKLFGRVHTLMIIIPAFAIFSVALFTLSFLNSFTHLIICAVIYGVGVGAALPTTNALVVKYAPIDRRGSANATYYSSFDIGMGVGSALWGFVIDYLGGYSVAFVGAGIFCIIAIIMSAFILRNMKL
ncbi:MAG: MFS transporter [Clostridia bacterium]|nr:MFS transporter [Clostridia bacterium]